MSIQEREKAEEWLKSHPSLTDHKELIYDLLAEVDLYKGLLKAEQADCELQRKNKVANWEESQSLLADSEMLLAEVMRLQKEVVNLNQRALDGDKAVALRDKLLDVNERLLAENKELAINLEFAYKRSKVLADMLGIPVQESSEVIGTILGLVRSSVEKLIEKNNNATKLIDDIEREYNKKSNDLIERHVGQITELRAENERLNSHNELLHRRLTSEELGNADTELRIAKAIRQTAEGCIELAKQEKYIEKYCSGSRNMMEEGNNKACDEIAEAIRYKCLKEVIPTKTNQP